MSSSVTRAVRFFSSVHGNLSSFKTGQQDARAWVKNSFFTPARFPYFLGVLAIGSFTFGWKGVDLIRDGHVGRFVVLLGVSAALLVVDGSTILQLSPDKSVGRQIGMYITDLTQPCCFLCIRSARSWRSTWLRSKGGSCQTSISRDDAQSTRFIDGHSRIRHL